MFHTYILVAGACLSFVSASVYPTQPVQATVWSADQPMLVTWVEDWKYPQLSEMGPLDISLWGNTDTFLLQLASSVDPMAKTLQVTAPAWVLKRGSTYTLRFTTSKPNDMVIYSADFSIIPPNTTTSAGMGSGVMDLATQSGTGTGTGAGSGFRTVITSTESSSTWSATAAVVTNATTTMSTSGQFGSTTPSGIPPPSGTIPGGAVPAGQRAASAGRRGVDVERLKFRFVFVIWPVLMGITMAL